MCPLYFGLKWFVISITVFATDLLGFGSISPSTVLCNTSNLLSWKAPSSDGEQLYLFTYTCVVCILKLDPSCDWSCINCSLLTSTICLTASTSCTMSSRKLHCTALHYTTYLGIHFSITISSWWHSFSKCLRIWQWRHLGGAQVSSVVTSTFKVLYDIRFREVKDEEPNCLPWWKKNIKRD